MVEGQWSPVASKQSDHILSTHRKQKEEQEVGQATKHQSPPPSDVLPPAELRLLKIPSLPQTAAQTQWPWVIWKRSSCCPHSACGSICLCPPVRVGLDPSVWSFIVIQCKVITNLITIGMEAAGRPAMRCIGTKARPGEAGERLLRIWPLWLISCVLTFILLRTVSLWPCGLNRRQ